MSIDWSKQHCGVHQAPYEKLVELMPDLHELLKTFPDKPYNYTWDVKVHMLMPNQYPCIPNWHRDSVPRVDGIQRFDLVDTSQSMYIWISGPPLTQFQHGFLQEKTWHRFNQHDIHRGIAAADFGWRGMIRATPFSILKPKESDWQRRHAQVYVDANTYQW